MSARRPWSDAEHLVSCGDHRARVFERRLQSAADPDLGALARPPGSQDHDDRPGLAGDRERQPVIREDERAAYRLDRPDRRPVEHPGEPRDDGLRRHDLVHRVQPATVDRDRDRQHVITRRVDVLSGCARREPDHLRGLRGTPIEEVWAAAVPGGGQLDADIVVDDRGNAYVNTIGFDFPGGEFAPGLVVLVTPEGNVGQVADDLAFPNGMAISPDGSMLVVAESYANRLTALDIGSDGDLGDRRVWAETPGDHPDGICMDAEGAVWYADVGNQHCVRVREGGEVLVTVDLDRGAFACALSRGEDPRLFVVAQIYGGPEPSQPSGQIVAFPAPSPGAGKP